MGTLRSDERGAVIVHVTIAIIGLVAMCALAIDAGVKWVSRAQAQNAADAGALAGAVALSFDDHVPYDTTTTGPAKQSAHNYAVANLVWGQPPINDPATDVTIDYCPPPENANWCVKVDVYRNQDRDNPLPTFFGRLVNILNQGVRATATAEVKISAATDCLKPWAIVDRWDEHEPNWPAPDPDFNLFTSTYDKYAAKNPQNDLYVAPTSTSPGTGWTVEHDYGTQYAIKTGAPGNAAVSSGWFRAVDLPRVDMANLGGSAYGENIRTCNGYPVNIADPSQVCPVGSAISTFQEKVAWAAKGCLRVETGVDQGNTRSGLWDLFNADPTAYWDATMPNGTSRPGGVANSRAPDLSPRVVPIAVMDIDNYLSQDPSGSGTSLKVVNIFGYFIEGMGDIDRTTGAIIFDPSNPFGRGDKVVVGRIMTLPGLPSRGAIDEDAAFLRTILLVR